MAAWDLLEVDRRPAFTGLYLPPGRSHGVPGACADQFAFPAHWNTPWGTMDITGGSRLSRATEPSPARAPLP